MLQCPSYSTHFLNNLQFLCSHNNILVLQMARSLSQWQSHWSPSVTNPNTMIKSLWDCFSIFFHALLFLLVRGEFSSILYSAYIVFKINICGSCTQTFCTWKRQQKAAQLPSLQLQAIMCQHSIAEPASPALMPWGWLLPIAGLCGG